MGTEFGFASRSLCWDPDSVPLLMEGYNRKREVRGFAGGHRKGEGGIRRDWTADARAKLCSSPVKNVIPCQINSDVRDIIPLA
jgi:hypothetical protein